MENFIFARTWFLFSLGPCHLSPTSFVSLISFSRFRVSTPVNTIEKNSRIGAMSPLHLHPTPELSRLGCALSKPTLQAIRPILYNII